MAIGKLSAGSPISDNSNGNGKTNNKKMNKKMNISLTEVDYDALRALLLDLLTDSPTTDVLFDCNFQLQLRVLKYIPPFTSNIHLSLAALAPSREEMVLNIATDGADRWYCKYQKILVI